MSVAFSSLSSQVRLIPEKLLVIFIGSPSLSLTQNVPVQLPFRLLSEGIPGAICTSSASSSLWISPLNFTPEQASPPNFFLPSCLVVSPAVLPSCWLILPQFVAI